MIRDKIFKVSLVIIILLVIVQLLVGFVFNNPQMIKSRTNTSKISPQKLFDRTWREVEKGFYDKSLNSQDWDYWREHYRGEIHTNADAKVAIDTMLASLDDEYSRYLNKKDYASQSSSIDSKITGIGVTIVNKSGKIIVHGVVDNTPAKKAGIKAEDVIIKVGDKCVSGMNVSDVASLVRGKIDTSVTLELNRDGKILTKTILREEIKIDSVKSFVKKDVGYIQILSFIGTSTTKEFLSALDKTKESKGLIVDLRGNTGGLLANAVFIANVFLENGTIVKIVPRNGVVEKINVHNSFLHIEKPVVLLVDGMSASASEILSGALKDHQKAVLVGTKTFGKGMVQRIIPLPNSTGLNLTIAKYLTPNGSDINEKGITPDYVVKMSEQDFRHHRDPQMKKAEKVLNKLIHN